MAIAATLTLALAAGAPAQELSSGPFTLERVLSAPFPTSLVAAPNHGKLAWVQNAEGRRNVWTASAPEYEGRPVTRFDEDDGQELSQLTFGPGGRHVVFVRGGGPNREGEIPNPRSLPEEASRSIWIVSAGGSGEPRKVADGAAPAISPDGEQIAFLREGDIYSVPSVEPGEAKRIAAPRGRATSLRWSPDGSRIAFVSERGDHGFVGILTLASNEARYLDPALANDSSPVFSPDGGRVAFLRIPNERRVLPFEPRRSAIPWSIRVVSLADGAGREIFRADEGPGSAFRGVVSDNQILWGAGDRLVFPWEKDGWTHLYSVPSRGGAATLLTPGAFEVEHVELGADGSEVLYSSNQGDVDRRHLFRVPVSGASAPREVTGGRGIEWSPRMTGDGGAIAYLASDARSPAHAVVRFGSAPARPLAPASIPEDFPTDALVEPEAVVISAADGMRVHTQLFLPRDRSDGERRPAVAFFHGGSRRQMLLGWHYMGYYHNAYAFNQYLASRGYVVLSVNYRSGTGYGMEFREALDYGARGASEFQDVLGAGLYLRGRDDVDPDRIALWGGSYGGYLTALGLARASDLFAAGVDVHGVHDWNVVIRNFVPSYDAAARDAFARLAFASSPMADVDSWRSPVLLVHGDDDRNVPFSESVDLAESLARRGVEMEQLVFPDEVHGFLLHENWLAAFRAAADFLDRKLEPSARAQRERSESRSEKRCRLPQRACRAEG